MASNGRQYSVAVIGATGAVGKVFLDIMEKRPFPLKELRLLASARSAGTRIRFRGEDITVEETTPRAIGGADFVFISATDEISKEYAPIAAEAGAVAIDDSGVWRMDPDVPLIVPEVNAADLAPGKRIVAIPNCSTTPLVMALAALQPVNPVRRVVVSTYQSVSGTGAAAMRELTEQSRQALDGATDIPGDVYPHQIAFNLLPHIGSFREEGYTSEEWKMVRETRKIMRLPDLPVVSTTVRVPVYICHSESVNLELSEPIEPARARELFAAFPGLEVVDDPATNAYPHPVLGANQDPVYVGRIRRDISHPAGLALWLVSDNLRKGAALNAIQIAETMIAKDLV
ncbi:MAG: aspartate-semialdehyde dehydrogenase [Dehalococcoidia bacterium]